MSAPQNFRSAFNGFNREDVVRYLEYVNTKHTTQVNQLNSEVDYLRARLETAQPDVSLAEERDALQAQVAELEARCAELEAKLAEATEPECAPVPAAAVPVVSTQPSVSDELEAYRRAERAERMARERAELVHHQINSILSEATIKVDTLSQEIGTMADQVIAQLSQLQGAVAGSKKTLQDAVTIMYSLKPNN